MGQRLNVAGTAALAAVIVLTPGCASEKPSAAESGGDVSARVTDAAITARVKTTYLFNEHLDSFRINVYTENRHVTLHGAVESDIQKDLAGEIAKNAKGVESVTNELQVTEGTVEKPDETERTFTQSVTDATTTASVKMALAFEQGVKASEIDVETRWGTVTLAGEVGTAAERELAEKVAEDVSGVQEVVNRIEVRA